MVSYRIKDRIMDNKFLSKGHHGGHNRRELGYFGRHDFSQQDSCEEQEGDLGLLRIRGVQDMVGGHEVQDGFHSIVSKQSGSVYVAGELDFGVRVTDADQARRFGHLRNGRLHDCALLPHKTEVNFRGIQPCVFFKARVTYLKYLHDGARLVASLRSNFEELWQSYEDLLSEDI